MRDKLHDINQRLIITGSQKNDLANPLKYELYHHQPSFIRRKGHPPRSHEITSSKCYLVAVPSQAQPSHNFKYVLDGGVLHCITWHIGNTYEKISQDYSNYVTKKYGQAVVVFDGYQAGSSTKDSTDRRRIGCQGQKVILNMSMKLQMKRFFALLGDKLCISECEVQHATRDADLLIVQTAMTLAGDGDAVLVGDNTDLLVLLL